MKKEVRHGVIIIEGHVQGLSNLRSLGELGVPIYVVDKYNCIARYSKYCRKFFKCPDYVTEEFADFLIELAESENLKGWILMPSNDHAVVTISRHKARLKEFYKIITPDYEIIENIYDKRKLLTLAEKIGVSIPRTYYVEHSTFIDNLNNVSYPVIIKGRFGLSFYKKLGRKAFLIGDETQMKECLNRVSCNSEINNAIVQELIPSDGTNKTISFTAFCEEGEVKTFWMGIKLREHPLKFGTATLAESIYVETCLENSIQLLKPLHYTGVCEIEYLKDPRDGMFKLIEINARTWLWVGLAKKCGIDYAKCIYFYLNDIPFTYPVRYDLGIRWINYFTDTVLSLKAILIGDLKLTKYLESFKGIKVPAIFQRNDLKPSLMFILLLPYLIFKRS